MKTKQAINKAKASKKYALTPSARLQRKQAAKKSAEVRRNPEKGEWVGTSVTKKNKEYAVLKYGSPDEAINTLRQIEESLNGVSIAEFLRELAAGKNALKKGGR